MHKYEISIFWSEDDGVFLAEVPALPGCMAHGDSQESALTNCQAAIGLWIDTARDLGRTIPKPDARRVRVVR